jgi:pimeloyl-ACP methyl ester carboxylesterase
METEPGVKLEVLDWGGNGSLLLLLPGMGNTAHVFDDFALAFNDRWHVVGLSRRGFGASTLPPSSSASYTLSALGTDILRVLDHLNAPRAVLVGHSFAGEELTWLALEHPERVTALVYLDAAYDRAAHGKEFAGASRPEPPTTAADFESARAYGAHLSRIMEMPVPLDEIVATFELDQRGRVVGPVQKADVITQMLSSIVSPDYARIQAPTLALYANADYWPSDKAAVFAREREQLARQLPRARIITVDHAPHYLYLTHQEQVVRDIRDFLGGLGQ